MIFIFSLHCRKVHILVLYISFSTIVLIIALTPPIKHLLSPWPLSQFPSPTLRQWWYRNGRLLWMTSTLHSFVEGHGWSSIERYCVLHMGFYIQILSNGSIYYYKAYLIACGFSQQFGLDYEETFSLAIQLNSVSILLSLAMNQYWPLHQLNVLNAFLYGELSEDIYMEQPLDNVVEGESSKVCHLYWAIYGLKQSPRAWFTKLNGIMHMHGFSACDIDPTVFHKTTSTWYVIWAVYIDDMLITGSDLLGIKDTKDFLH